MLRKCGPLSRQQLCKEYSETLNTGLHDGYALAYEYAENDCVFIDTLAMAHRALPEAHLPAAPQGFRWDDGIPMQK